MNSYNTVTNNLQVIYHYGRWPFSMQKQEKIYEKLQ